MDRIRRLELFVRAAEAGGFARAARILNLDPSAVSHAVAELEKELGRALFYRTTRQLKLTEDGEAVRVRCHDIIGQLEDLYERGDRHTELKGTLRIGMFVPVSCHIIMPRLSRFIDRNPNLKLELLMLAQVRDFHATGVDVMLRPGEPPDSMLIARRLGRFRFQVYAAPAYLDAFGEPATPADLVRHRCLVHKPVSEEVPWDEWEHVRNGKRDIVRVPRTVLTDDREGLIAAAIAGAGLIRIGLFDPSLISTGRLRPVLTDWTWPTSHALYAIYRRAQILSPKIAAFLQFVDEALLEFDPDSVTFVRDAAPRGMARIE